MKQLLNKLSDWYFSKDALSYWIVLAFDCTLVLMSNLLLFSFNNDAIESVGGLAALLGTVLFYTLCHIVGFKMMHTYSGVMRYSSFLDLLRIGIAMTVNLVVIMLVRWVLNTDEWMWPVNIKVLFEALVLSTLLMWCERILVKFMYESFYSVSKQRNVFIYGVKEGGIALAKSVRNNKPSIYRLKGFITDDEKEVGSELMARKVYLRDKNIINVMKDQKIEILLVSPLKSNALRVDETFQKALIEAGIKIYMMPSLQEWDHRSNLDYTQLKEVNIEDLLPREQIGVDMDAIGQLLADKTILITGSAGSIGSEMVRQIAGFKPKRMVLIDQAETPQHDIRLMLQHHWPDLEVYVVVTNICREGLMEKLFREHRPEYVFHAAAYKHVPMMEDNPFDAVLNNVLGTQIIAKLSVKYGVKKFVMISTDKAVNPTNVMGCSKRICEIDVQSMDSKIKALQQSNGMMACPFQLAEDVPAPITQFVTTRFGNVLGSNGSVIPIFKEQIKNGGPVTVTHPDIIRFFMLIPEACKLVLEAGTMGNGGEIFVFDMGKPVRIVDLAERMIMLSGAKNIEIKFSGLRDGEKLYEEVLADREMTKATKHPKIMVAAVRESVYEDVSLQLEKLYKACETWDDMNVVKIMKEMVPEFKSKHSKYERLDVCGE